MVKQNHKWHIHRSFTQHGKNDRLSLFSSGLKHSQRKERHGRHGTGGTDDTQEPAAICHRLAVVDKQPTHSGSLYIQKHCNGQCHSKTEYKQSTDCVQHALFVPRSIVITNERQCSLGNTLPHGKRQHIEFLCNSHSGHSHIGIAGNNMVEYHIGNRTHHRNKETRHSYADDLCRNVFSQRIHFRRKRQHADTTHFPDKCQEINHCGCVGNQCCNRRSGDLQMQSVNKQWIQYHVQNTAKCHAQTCLPGISF